MAELKVSPFAGIDHVTGEPNEPKWLKDAVNVDIDRFGGMTRRNGVTEVLAGVKSVFGSSAVGSLVGVYNGQLAAISVSPPAATPLGEVNDTELWYAEVNGELVYAGMSTLGVVRDGGATPLGVDVPPSPMVVVSAGGRLQEGTYGVCVTYVSDATGEESGASTATWVDVPQGGRIVVSPVAQAGMSIRRYRTTCNGDVFYLDSDGQLGMVCETRNKVRMPPGRFLSLWKGRILVARGNVVYMSEPFRYGLYDPREGFIQVPKVVTFIAAVDGGIYVGQPDGVLFIDGQDIKQVRLVTTGASAPLRGSAVVVDGGDMSIDNVDSSKKYAVWFCERGYAIGKPDGGVVEPQSSRIRIPVGQRGATALHERRVLSLVS